MLRQGDQVFHSCYGDELHLVGPLVDLLNHLDRTRALVMTPRFVGLFGRGLLNHLCRRLADGPDWETSWLTSSSASFHRRCSRRSFHRVSS